MSDDNPSTAFVVLLTIAIGIAIWGSCVEQKSEATCEEVCHPYKVQLCEKNWWPTLKAVFCYTADGKVERRR